MKTKRVAIYARVSTGEQNVDMQTRELKTYAELRGWQVVEVFEDKGFSGSTTQRPGLKAILGAAKQRQFDIVLVWKLDRFGRSLKDLIVTIQGLVEIGVEFCSLKDSLDLTTAHGRLMLGMLGAFAEFERDTIISRVNAGLAAARARGQRLGRPQLRDDAAIRTLANKGKSQRSIAKELGISKGSVQNALNGWTRNPSK